MLTNSFQFNLDANVFTDVTAQVGSGVTGVSRVAINIVEAETEARLRNVFLRVCAWAWRHHLMTFENKQTLLSL